MHYEQNGILEFRVFRSSDRQSIARDRKKTSIKKEIRAILVLSAASHYFSAAIISPSVSSF
jgi:hypothetical protein